jgi:hypothetical protein
MVMAFFLTIFDVRILGLDGSVDGMDLVAFRRVNMTQVRRHLHWFTESMSPR